jgi:heme-degrading monooxygenase HmoA
MHARSTTVQGEPRAVEEGIAYVRDTVMPAVQEMDGWIGLSMLCARDTGRCIVTTSWGNADVLHRSAREVAAMRQRTAEILGGEAEVDEWEIAVMHRRHETHYGACARVIRAEVDPAGLDSVLDGFRVDLLPRIEELPGFVGVSLLVDRASGRTATAVGYDSRLSMAEAERPGMALRQDFTSRMGMTITHVAAYDIALAHLRIPETV